MKISLFKKNGRFISLPATLKCELQTKNSVFVVQASACRFARGVDPLWLLLRRISFSILLVAGIFLSGCTRNDGRINLLLITLDTTRYDRLGCTGHISAHTPALDRLAAEGVLFQQMRSCVPITLPSHTTMLTGLTPPEHGLRYNAEGCLPDNIPTLATILKEKGYATGAVLASPVLEAVYGLNRGFDFYEDRVLKEDNPETGESLRHTERYRAAPRVTELSLKWLKERTDNGNSPWFLWTHFYDPHYPRQLHKELFNEITDEYDSEVAFMDHYIGKILEFLDERHLTGRTLVVAVGDHGEGLGEHGEETHGFFLYDATQHVPFLMRLPGKIEAGRRVVAERSLDDILPSVLEILGVDYKTEFKGRLDGVPDGFGRELLSGDPVQSKSCYLETLWTKDAFGWAPLYGVVDDGFKYVRSAKCQLHDLTEDPAEKENLYGTDGGVNARRSDEMDVLLAGMRSGMKAPVAKQVKLNAEQIRRLNSLGYTAGGSHTVESGEDDFKLRDVKEMKELIPVYTEVKARIRHDSGAPDMLEKSARLAQGSPETAIFHSFYASALLAAGRGEEAVREYQDAVRLDPSNISYHNNLANVLVELKREREALEHVKMALSLNESQDTLKKKAVARLKKNLEYLRKVCGE